MFVQASMDNIRDMVHESDRCLQISTSSGGMGHLRSLVCGG